MISFQSINHTDYSLEEREQYFRNLRLDPEQPHVFLQTCNRIEVYWGEGEIPDEVARHLYRVASGLESSLIGERAIQGQLKNAYQEACVRYKLSSSLNRLFQTAIHAGKRVRTETKISEGAISHSQATVDILCNKNIDLEKSVVTIIGVNKLTEDILKFLKTRKSEGIFLANRNFPKVQALAEKYDFKALPLKDKKRFLEFTDVLICATSAPHSIVHADEIAPDKQMLIFDLSFPCDVDKEIGLRDTIELYNLEAIEKSVQLHLQQRHDEIAGAESIIEEELEKLYQWYAFCKKLPHLIDRI